MKLILLIFILILISCDGRPEMEKLFKERPAIIFIDEKTCEKYMIEHHLGTTYSMVPLKEKSKNCMKIKEVIKNERTD